MAIGFAVQLLGGLAIVAGLRTAAAALILIGFLVVATALYHNPLMFHGKERAPHLYLMLVNITLAAGLLLVIADAT
jgi:putative oxidoreductase